MFLVREGYGYITTASTMSEALIAIQNHSFDLIISDIVLEEKKGTDLLCKIREAGIECPVVMVTGFPNLDTASEAVRYGAFDYISKPVNKETLLKFVRQALKHWALENEKKKLHQENEKYKTGNLLDENLPFCYEEVTGECTSQVPLSTVTDGNDVFDFYEDFDDSNLENWEVDKGLVYKLNNGILTIDVKKGLAHRLSFNIQNGYIIETRVKVKNTNGKYSGVFASPMSSGYMSSNNTNSDANILYMKSFRVKMARFDLENISIFVLLLFQKQPEKH